MRCGAWVGFIHSRKHSKTNKLCGKHRRRQRRWWWSNMSPSWLVFQWSAVAQLCSIPQHEELENQGVSNKPVFFFTSTLYVTYMLYFLNFQTQTVSWIFQVNSILLRSDFQDFSMPPASNRSATSEVEFSAPIDAKEVELETIGLCSIAVLWFP